MIQVGSKVRIRKEFWILRKVEDPGIIMEMRDYEGEETIVLNIKPSTSYPGITYYRLNIDNGKHLWFDQWLEEEEEENCYEKKIVEFCTKQCICECSKDCVWFQDMKKLTFQEGSNPYK